MGLRSVLEKVHMVWHLYSNTHIRMFFCVLEKLDFDPQQWQFKGKTSSSYPGTSQRWVVRSGNTKKLFSITYLKSGSSFFQLNYMVVGAPSCSSQHLESKIKPGHLNWKPVVRFWGAEKYSALVLVLLQGQESLGVGRYVCSVLSHTLNVTAVRNLVQINACSTEVA